MIPRIIVWHKRWVAARDEPRSGARRRHASLLAQLGLQVQRALDPPGTSKWLVIGQMYWDPPLEPVRTSSPPRFLFEGEPEFPDLVAHLPELGTAIPPVYASHVAYAKAFSELKDRVHERLKGAFPGLPSGVATEALVTAVIALAMDLSKRPDSRLEPVRLEPGDITGTRSARVFGRVAANLPPAVADSVAAGLHGLVRDVVRGGGLNSVDLAYRNLGEVLGRARRHVRSDSAIRLALVARTCSTCRQAVSQPS